MLVLLCRARQRPKGANGPWPTEGPVVLAMSNSNAPPSSTLASYLEQTASVLSSAASYMRLPALASTVSFLSTPHRAINVPSNGG